MPRKAHRPEQSEVMDGLLAGADPKEKPADKPKEPEKAPADKPEEPFDPVNPDIPRPTNPDEPKPAEPAEPAQPAAAAHEGPPKGALSESAVSRYESRIRVLEAFQYPGSLAKAPSFVERTWAAYGDADPARDLPPGPALRVPSQNPQGMTLCRVGDYVVRAEITIADGVCDERIEVWQKDVFEKLFLPIREAEPPAKPAAPPTKAEKAGMERTVARGAKPAAKARTKTRSRAYA